MAYQKKRETRRRSPSPAKARPAPAAAPAPGAPAVPSTARGAIRLVPERERRTDIFRAVRMSQLIKECALAHMALRSPVAPREWDQLVGNTDELQTIIAILGDVQTSLVELAEARVRAHAGARGVGR